MSIGHEDFKKNMKRLAEGTQIKAARGVLRCKHGGEGKTVPTTHPLKNAAMKAVRRAHTVIANRGRNAWNERKGVYLERSNPEEDSKEWKTTGGC